MIKRLGSFFSVFVLLFCLSCDRDRDALDPLEPTDLSTFDCDRPYVERDSIINTGTLEGYADKLSYFPGDTVHLSIHSMDSVHELAVYRYGATVEEILPTQIVSGRIQHYEYYSYSWGCEWDTTFSFQIPTDARSGLYSVKLSTNSEVHDYISFVVKSTPGQEADILVLASTNTWLAYNSWSGPSFYGFPQDDDIPTSQIVSIHRPNNADSPIGFSGHLTNAELHLLRWLEEKGYDYSMCADLDIDESDKPLETAEVLMLNVHSEYWTKKMYWNLKAYLNKGKDLMYLSGNGVYWKVAWACGRIEVRKHNDYHLYDGTPGGRWVQLGHPEASIIGVSYSRAGYNTYHPYEVFIEDHWAFEGTNLKKGSLFGETGLNKGGASGWETDKITKDSPLGLIHLAKGTNPDQGGADMVLYENKYGGKVFSVGSITYTGSLSVDANVSQITENVLTRFLNE